MSIHKELVKDLREAQERTAQLEAERDMLREAARNYRIAVHVWALMECAESAVPAMTEASNKLTELLNSGEGE